MHDTDLTTWCRTLNELIERGADIRVQIRPLGEASSPQKFRCMSAFHEEHGKIAGNAIGYGPFTGLEPHYEFGIRGFTKPQEESVPA